MSDRNVAVVRDCRLERRGKQEENSAIRFGIARRSQIWGYLVGWSSSRKTQGITVMLETGWISFHLA